MDEPRADTPRRARTRERLMDAAYAVFAEVGVAAATVEQVAERAGFTRGAFYSNFSTKEELFLALMARDRGQWLVALTEGVDRWLPAAPTAALATEDIGTVLAMLLTGPFEHRRWCLIQDEFRLLALRDPELAEAFAADREEFEASLVPIAEHALSRAGRRFTLDPRTAIRVASAVFFDAVATSALHGTDDQLSMTAVRATLTEVLAAITEPV